MHASLHKMSLSTLHRLFEWSNRPHDTKLFLFIDIIVNTIGTVSVQILPHFVSFIHDINTSTIVIVLHFFSTTR